MKFVDDDHVVAVRLDVFATVDERLHRGEDVAARPGALAADQSLTEPGFTQDELEDLVALTKDFLPVRDEEKGVARSFTAQPLEIECRNPGLAGTGCGDDEIAVMSAQALRLERLECHGLLGLRCDVDQQRDFDGIVRFAAATLPR